MLFGFPYPLLYDPSICSGNCLLAVVLRGVPGGLELGAEGTPAYNLLFQRACSHFSLA